MTAPPHVPTVLVVCTANLCRSPLAAAALRSHLEHRSIAAEVHSAGVDAFAGGRPDRKLVQAAAELGLDVSAHRSDPIRRAEVVAAELIIVMTADHVERLARLVPAAAGRVTTLRGAAVRARALNGRPVDLASWVRRLSAEIDGRRAASEADDIDDPTGGSLRDYRRSAAEIDGLVAMLASHWPSNR